MGKVEGGLGVLVTNNRGIGGWKIGRKEKGGRKEGGGCYVSIIDSKKHREKREMLTGSHHKPQ